jgi:hypothetical protein
MPEELRQRLADAAARSGRSLNSELLHRLERSLEHEAARQVPAWLRVPGLARGTISGGENAMHRRSARRRLLAVGAVAAIAASAAVTAAVMGPSSSPEAVRAEQGEGPRALQRHLDKLKRAMPGNAGMAEEGPASAAEFEFMQRAFPADSISLANMEAARTSFSETSRRPFPGARGRPGVWMSIGPSKALYPFEELRNWTNYVPNAYVAGGRTTALALNEANCTERDCVLYITPAGGGIWRASHALRGASNWTYLAGPLGINSAGAVTIDPNDPSGNTIYVGTGEANICGSGCVAGVGVYKSTNGGATWTGPLGGAPTDTGNPLAGKGIGQIVVKPGDSNTLYVGTTTALRGMSSVCCSGVTRPVPGIAKWGLYKSTNGGATWSFIHNGAPTTAVCTGDLTEFSNAGVCSPRGVRHVQLDPTNPEIVYASSYARGIWRSSDGGATWVQIKPSLNPAIIQTRASIDVTTLPSGKTRMYVYEGHVGAGGQYSRLFRSDDVSTGVPVFTDLTSDDPALPGWAWFNLCTGQCWYDVLVYTPKGHPDVVYAGGSYLYGESTANKRGLILSTDAGVTGTDMTFDATDQIHPNGLHPDQHDIVTNPNNPFEFIEANDGGVMRSNGRFSDVSSWCDGRGLSPTRLARCKQMLSRVPSRLESMNNGLRTLQFMSLSVSPHNVDMLQGGTQDNGTWENRGPVLWENTMIGDGGWSGFDVAIPEFRFHDFFDVTPEVNYESGDLAAWIWVADPLFFHAGSQFYAPVISDPTVSKTMFAGTGRTAYRTKTHGLGTMTMEEAHEKCNTWTGSFPPGFTCGDWAELGPVRLTDAAWGTRAGGAVAAIERTKADTSSAWAATTTGRVFVSKNVDAEPVEERVPRIPPDDPYTQRVATNVTWTRIDDDFPVSPGRFVSSIYVDPANGNHAWISYSGYNANTPTTPGHVFEVTYNPVTGLSTWVARSYDWGDMPATDLVRDDVTGDLFASTDFGVSRLAAGTTSWTLAGTGMPNVEITGLTIIPDKRRLYAASHGLSAWQMNLG